MRYTKPWRTTKWYERLRVGVPAEMNCGSNVFPHSTKPITHEGQPDSSGFANGVTDAYQANDRKTRPPLACKPQNTVRCQRDLPLKKVCGYDPVPKAISTEKTKHILGVQGQPWGEYISTPAHREHMAYPRAAALVEVA